ncbi:recombinase family protein [Vibrio crassostreae]|uniref:recombinase family protein n=1 Tax=Vibrio crassostreae TaxID=246167 RepID=UPI001B301EA6
MLGLNEDRLVVGYARVSSHDQKSELVTQAEFLKNYGCDEVISDLGSGMNCRKRGLHKLLKLIINHQVKRLV